MKRHYERLQDAATELVDAAKAMREADPNQATDLIFALCSAVAGTLPTQQAQSSRGRKIGRQLRVAQVLAREQTRPTSRPQTP